MKKRILFVAVPVIITVTVIVFCSLFRMPAEKVTIGKAGGKIRVKKIEEKSLTFIISELSGENGNVRVVIKDLDGKDLASAKGRIDGNSAEVRVPITVDMEKTPEYVVLYRTSAKDEYSAESLFYLFYGCEAMICGDTDFYAGGSGVIRIMAHHRSTLKPIQNAKATVSIKRANKNEEIVSESTTNEYGTTEAKIDFDSESAGSVEIIAKVESDIGADIVRKSITIKSGNKILLTTDKPLYQPGQTVHMRALATVLPGTKPATKKDVIVEINDPKRNIVFRKKLQANDFGIVADDFVIADEVIEGTYTAKAAIGDAEYPVEFKVERYVLPKFKVSVKMDKNYFLRDEPVKGEVSAEYFFGKPVTKGDVSVKIFWDERTFYPHDPDYEPELVKEIKGSLNEKGKFNFEKKIDAGSYVIKASVSTESGIPETGSAIVTVSYSPIKVWIIPECGGVREGMDNVFYIVAKRFDGSPVQMEIKVVANFPDHEDTEQIVQTNKAGLAVFTQFVGSYFGDFAFSYTDDSGKKIENNIDISNYETYRYGILIRCDKAIYKIGEPIKVEILSEVQDATVYCDLAANKGTIATREVTIKDGKASFEIPAVPEIAGIITINAYMVGSKAWNEISRVNKTIYIEPDNKLDITFQTEKDIHSPGEEAQVKFTVTDSQKKPVVSALGVTGVDESIFAMREMKTGAERLNLTLPNEVLSPEYYRDEIPDVLDMVFPELGRTKEQKDLNPADRDIAAKILMARTSLVLSTEIESYYKYNSRARWEFSNYAEERLKKSGEELAKALDAFFKKLDENKGNYWGKSKIDKSKRFLDVAILVESGFLTSTEIIDPWGYKYSVTAVWDEWDKKEERWGARRFGIRSIGPDGIEYTADDFEVYSEYDRNMYGADSAKEEAAESGDEEFSNEEKGGTPRIRKYFPETLFVAPMVITDAEGKAELTVPLADSITDWRITALANSLSGGIGSTVSDLRVFQPFFVDIDFPVSLTQNDEVSVPVSVYNYLDKEQTVKLKVEAAEWFELLDDAEKEVTVLPNDVKSTNFRLRAKQPGRHGLTLLGFGNDVSDAVKREVEILPDGKEYVLGESGKLEGSITSTMTIPDGAIDGASKVFVKIYLSPLSQAAEGMDSILHMPYGCFEQTTSVTYPNVLALSFMKSTGKIMPSVQARAEEFVSTGYQMMLSYEVKGGGFEWYGKEPANLMLTAYGLMALHDMSKVATVDEAVISRTQKWLSVQQAKDGSWSTAGAKYGEELIEKAQANKFRATSYVLWALLRSGFKGGEISKGMEYITKNLDDATDLYTLALTANVFLEKNPKDAVVKKIIISLMEKAIKDSDTLFLNADEHTQAYSSGDAGDIELTALACQALIKAGGYDDTANKMIKWLAAKKDAEGTWCTTQATIQALSAMLLFSKGGEANFIGTIKIRMNEGQPVELKINDENNQILNIQDFKEQTIEGDNKIELSTEGKGAMYYQITGRYYLPYTIAEEEKLSIVVNYNKTELIEEEQTAVTVTATNSQPLTSTFVIVELGTPPGFSTTVSDFDEMVKQKKIDKYTIKSDGITVYMGNLKSKEARTINYHLTAKYPVKAKAPASIIYDYYNPEIRGESPPQEFIVKGK